MSLASGWPASLDSTEINVFGTGFGTDASAVAVSLGDVMCDVAFLTNERIKCSFRSIPKAGKQHLQVAVG